jgi:hypothetical protein
MSLKDSELVRMTGKLENMQVYTQTIEKEVKEWRNKVESLNSEIHQGASQNIQQEHKKYQ